MGAYIPFDRSDQLLRSIIGATYVGEPGRFSPLFKWRTELLSIVRASLEPQRILPTGSWSHGTAIKGISDQDYFLVLPGSPSTEPAVVLDGLYTDMSDAVSTATELYVDSPAVCIANPHTGLLVEFVPAYRDRGSDYLIPHPHGTGWMPSDPVAHTTYLNRANAAEYRVRYVIRMMKAWKAGALPGLSSLYVEMLTAQHYLENPNLSLLEHLTGVLDALVKAQLADLRDPSLTDVRMITAFADSTINVERAVGMVVEARDLTLRIDAAERSRSIGDVEAYLSALFQPAERSPIMNSRSFRTRRDPNRVQFRGTLRGIGGHAGRVRIPRNL